MEGAFAQAQSSPAGLGWGWTVRCEVQGARCDCPRAVRSHDWWVSVPPTPLQVARSVCVPSLPLMLMLTSAVSARLDGEKTTKLNLRQAKSNAA